MTRSSVTDTADIPQAYVRQMATYRALLRQIYPDKSVDCALLWTDGPNLMPVPAEMLDAVSFIAEET